MQTHVICPSDEAAPRVHAMATETFAAGGTCDDERELVRADSSRFWARLQGAPVRAGDADAGTIWIFTDITESRRHREQLSWSASHDELTGPGQPARVRAAPGRGARRARRRRAGRGAVHRPRPLQGGQRQQRPRRRRPAAQAHRERSCSARARAHDTVARIGGDEFAVLLRGCDPRAAERIAAAICSRVASHRLEWGSGGRRSAAVGASIGIVAIDADFTVVETRCVLLEAGRTRRATTAEAGSGRGRNGCAGVSSGARMTLQSDRRSAAPRPIDETRSIAARRRHHGPSTRLHCGCRGHRGIDETRSIAAVVLAHHGLRRDSEARVHLREVAEILEGPIERA